jgi:hypothetical protein
MPRRRTIVVDDETYNEIYSLKGPRRTMQDAIRDLLESCFPTKGRDPTQEVLNTGDLCPLCETVLMEDEEGIYCPNRSCGWVES